jgi:small subunit ribosomal protein S20
MPRRKSSVMHTRLSEKKHRQNLKIRQEIKKTIKKFLALLSAKDIEEAKKLLVKAFSQLDKAAKKKIIHPKLASRRKSRLSKRLGSTKAA